MVKRGGANIVKGLENDKSDFLTKTLKYCNAFGVFTNFVIVFICMIVIGFSWKSMRKYKEVDAKVISVTDKSDNQKCLSKAEKKPGEKKISYCVVNFEYVVNGQTITSSIETTITKEVTDQSALLIDLNSQMESLRDRYVLQFTSMEQAVTSLKSTGEYLTNLFEAMNKDD